jgi:glycosyltransferase involved in cell wall biosynthesis
MISIIVPVKNEPVSNVTWFLDELSKENNSFEITIVDADYHKETEDTCHLFGIYYMVQTGKGMPTASNQALEVSRGDVVVIVSPDGNCTPSDIAKLAKHITDGADMVIASRYLSGGKSLDDDLVTAMGNKFFTYLVNILFGTKYSDVLTMFRAYSRASLDRMNITEQTWAGRYSPIADGWEIRSLVRAKKLKMKVVEMLSVEQKRIAGHRKMNPLRNGVAALVQIGWELLNKRVTTRKDVRDERL